MRSFPQFEHSRNTWTFPYLEQSAHPSGPWSSQRWLQGAFLPERKKSWYQTAVYYKGWLPRAKLRPLVKIRLARPIRGQHFRSSFFSFWSGLIYWYQWGLLLRIQFVNNAWTLLYLHFHWKKTECFRVRKTWNVKVKLQGKECDCWGWGAMKRGGKGRG